MQEYIEISRIELEQKVTEQELRPLQILVFGMFGFIFIFFAVILYLYNMNINNLDILENNPFLFVMLMGSLLFLAVPQYSMLFILPKILLSPAKIMARLTQPVYYKWGGEIDDPVMKLLMLYRNVMIMRFALLEGVAFYGLGVVFIGVTNGAVYDQAIIWLALFPMAIMIIFGYLFFPSREKVIFYIENNMLKKIRPM